MKITNLVKLDEAPIRATANRANANAQAREQTAQQSQQQQQQGPAKHTANKAADNEATREQQPQQAQRQQAPAGPQTEVGKAIVDFIKQNPDQAEMVRRRLARLISLGESYTQQLDENIFKAIANREYKASDKKKQASSKGLTAEQIKDKWDEAGNPTTLKDIQKFLLGLDLDDETIKAIFNNAGVQTTGDDYDNLHLQMKKLKVKDENVFKNEIQAINNVIKQIGAK